ncbi:MAG: hypothetical protein JW884_13855 [Deltaproteobacteria bacterium]|nr:hypothetical protein [Deltaproteobacteria bacterium]
MVSITSYLHRTALRDVIARWMRDDPYPDDAVLIAKLLNFNNLYVSRYLGFLAGEIFRELHGDALAFQRVSRKGVLKDIITHDPPYRTNRIDSLIGAYQAHPGRFYGNTPFHGVVYFKQEGPRRIYVGSSRIKRMRRLAEKASRRIVDGLFGAAVTEVIEDKITAAKNRWTRAPLDDDCLAEERIIDAIEKRRCLPEIGTIEINDVAGIKLILEDDERSRFLDLLRRREDCEIIEEEAHRGRYNALNVTVSFHHPFDELSREPPDAATLALMECLGLGAADSASSFVDFVRTGEKKVRLEIIISSYLEMLESEVGRSIHEDRIIEQRMNRRYRGHLARNVEYLMEYLFVFPSSGRRSVGDLPIKLGNRYLPDYFDGVLKELFGIPAIGNLD